MPPLVICHDSAGLANIIRPAYHSPPIDIISLIINVASLRSQSLKLLVTPQRVARNYHALPHWLTWHYRSLEWRRDAYFFITFCRRIKPFRRARPLHASSHHPALREFLDFRPPYLFRLLITRQQPMPRRRHASLLRYESPLFQASSRRIALPLHAGADLHRTDDDTRHARHDARRCLTHMPR